MHWNKVRATRLAARRATRQDALRAALRVGQQDALTVGPCYTLVRWPRCMTDQLLRNSSAGLLGRKTDDMNTYERTSRPSTPGAYSLSEPTAVLLGIGLSRLKITHCAGQNNSARLGKCRPPAPASACSHTWLRPRPGATLANLG